MMNKLEKLGNKESIRKYGASPFAKKQNQAIEQITTKISRDKHNQLKMLAFQNGTTMFNLIDGILEDGIQKLENENKNQ